MSANAVENAPAYIQQIFSQGRLEVLPTGYWFAPLWGMNGYPDRGLFQDSDGNYVLMPGAPDPATWWLRAPSYTIATEDQVRGVLMFSGTGGINQGGNQGLNFGLPDQSF